MVSRLQRAGYTVDVPPNPLAGLSYDSATLRDFLDTILGPVILVGHSYGGSVITNAATGDPNVRALVYVDGLAPDQGQTAAQLINAVPGSCVGSANLILVPYPGATAGVEDAYLKPGVFGSCLANGLPASEASARAYHRDRRAPLVDDRRSRRRDQGHPPSRPRHYLISMASASPPVDGWHQPPGPEKR